MAEGPSVVRWLLSQVPDEESAVIASRGQQGGGLRVETQNVGLLLMA